MTRSSQSLAKNEEPISKSFPATHASSVCKPFEPMGDYFYAFNNEATVPCVDAWIATQPQLGCQSCGRVTSPFAVNAEVEYVCDFSDLTTRTNRRWRPKHVMGGSVTIITSKIVKVLGQDMLSRHFFIGNVKRNGKVLNSHVTLVARNPAMALSMRSERPLHVIECDLCNSVCHAFDGPAHVVSSMLTEPIYPQACSGNGFIVRSDIADALCTVTIPGMEMEPIEVKAPLRDNK